MHLTHRLAAVVLTLGLSASLVGCGFHLVGKGPYATPVAYNNMALSLPNKANALEEKLVVYLTGNGIHITTNANQYTLRVLDYNYRRQKLSGRVAEVILQLNATFQIEDKNGKVVTQPRTISSVKSYQYNVATVNVDDNEESYLNNILVDDVAQQMARQIATNRLPTTTSP
ncbi:LPS-assembly lipoprotein LptE [Acinetobacter boissieri]|uniref:LPS-assembly lipoprotein LptE n=1 Tax=Acinetobacter boissieri TaxID=1219383 RepID=A0A1G6GGA1_9GAMM|nr:LPS assembly lipoprotein LptE [Acinetobacter boissieri]SDB81031.1 LPS-assembly lipoprotein [Acinetobacter boissieri]